MRSRRPRGPIVELGDFTKLTINQAMLWLSFCIKLDDPTEWTIRLVQLGVWKNILNRQADQIEQNQIDLNGTIFIFFNNFDYLV